MATADADPARLTLDAPRDAAHRAWRDPAAWRLRVLSVVALFAVWWLLTEVVGNQVVPSPVSVGRALRTIAVHGDFLFNIGQTLLRVVLGMLATLALSVTVGVAMGLDRRLEKFFELFVLLGRAIPGLAWALLSVMIVGINNGAPILAITMASTPMVTLQMWEGTKALDRDLLQMAHVFGLSRQHRLRHIVLPSILPYMVAGTKLGLALSWQVVVLSELFGLSNGVGFKINQAFAAFSIPAVIAWTLSFTAVMAIIEFGMLGPLERRLTRWRRTGVVV